MTPWLLLGVICSALAATAVLHVVLGIALASFARVQNSRAALGMGPRLCSFDVAGTRLDVRLLPLTSYTQPLGINPYVNDPPPAPPRLLWLDAPTWRRALVFVIAPRVAAFILGLAILGGARATGAVTRGVGEVFTGFGGGRELLDTGAAVLVREGVGVLFALALCKLVSAGMLFLPTDLATALVTRRTEALNIPLTNVRGVVMLASLLLWGAWLVTWLRWAF